MALPGVPGMLAMCLCIGVLVLLALSICDNSFGSELVMFVSFVHELYYDKKTYFKNWKKKCSLGTKQFGGKNIHLKNWEFQFLVPALLFKAVKLWVTLHQSEAQILHQ